MENIENISAIEISDRVNKGEFSAVTVCEYFKQRAQALNSKFNAVVSWADSFEQRARDVDLKVRSGQSAGRLAGVPVLLKDMICHEGELTRAASKILENYRSPFSATLVDRLENEGAVIMGKTNQDEFGMGSSNENSVYGPCLNPWDIDRTPGGSSGGAAAAAAARMAPINIGTDTGGSVRQPASYCGVYGFKPTYGRISRHGILAFASSLDQAGVLSPTLQDLVRTTEIISGFCPLDATTSDHEVPKWEDSLDKDVGSLRVGVLKGFFEQLKNSESRHLLEEAIKDLKSFGVDLVEVDLKLSPYHLATYYILAMSEASSNLSRYDGIRFGFRASLEGAENLNLEELYRRTRGQGFGDEVKRRILMGTFALSSGYRAEYFGKASQVRRLIQKEYLELLNQCDLLISPVTQGPAFCLGENSQDPLEMYLTDLFTLGVSLAGLPALSMPCGRVNGRWPVGLQLIGRPFDEQSIFNLARALDVRKPPERCNVQI